MSNGKRVGNVMQAARGHAHVLRHRTVHAITKAFARGAEVVATCAAQHARAADLRRRFADHAIAFAKAGNTAADTGHGAAKLVPEDHRDIDRPRMGVARLMHVRSADRHGSNLEEHLPVAKVWNRNLAELDCVRLERELNNRCLRGHFLLRDTPLLSLSQV